MAKLSYISATFRCESDKTLSRLDVNINNLEGGQLG
jgi:hypothetical protein